MLLRHLFRLFFLEIILVATTGCYNPPDFENPPFTSSGAGSSSADAYDEANVNGFDLPVAGTVELRCAFGPDDPATDEKGYEYDLFFEKRPAAYDPEDGESESEAESMAVIAPVGGLLTYVDDPLLGHVAVIWWDDNPTALLIGGMTRTTSERERGVEPGTVLGWIEADGDGHMPLLSIGFRRGEPLEWTAPSESLTEDGVVSAPTTFRTRDASWDTDPVSLTSENFVCGADGHIYESIMWQ